MNVGGRLDGWASGRANDRMGGRAGERASGRAGERAGERASGQAGERGVRRAKAGRNFIFQKINMSTRCPLKTELGSLFVFFVAS